MLINIQSNEKEMLLLSKLIHVLNGFVFLSKRKNLDVSRLDTF